MKQREPEIIRGSRNIYRDFDLPDADVRQLKAVLAAAIIKMLDRRGLSVRAAQRPYGNRRRGLLARTQRGFSAYQHRTPDGDD